MTSAEIQRLFKIFGKVIFYSRAGDQDSDRYRKTLAGLIDQTTEGNASDADTIVKFASPAIGEINKTIGSLAAVPTTAKTIGATLLTQVVAVDLGLRAGAKLSLIGPQLADAMDAAGESVAASGVNGTNDDGFAMYFASQYGIELPQDPTPTIPDAWIDDDVIP